jgi:hypothetical protein
MDTGLFYACAWLDLAEYRVRMNQEKITHECVYRTQLDRLNDTVFVEMDMVMIWQFVFVPQLD